MSLTSLNYDILSNICSLFKTRRSLLDLALTCRTLHSVIIPAFLYEQLEFPRRLYDSESLVRFQSFVHAIHAADSTAASAIRHIEVPNVECLRSFWTQSIPLMRNLCSIAVPEWFTPTEWLSPMPHLHTLSLQGCDDDCLEPLRELSGLRSLSIGLAYPIELTLDSALTVALLNSRGTLTKLSLTNFKWRLPTRSADLGELVWPNVVELSILDHAEDNSVMDFNLIHHFPSVHLFDCTENIRWDRPFSVPFLTRLLSLDAPFHLVTYARRIGAPLQRAVIYAPDKYVTLNSYLPPDIRSVTFDYGPKCTVHPFRQLEGLAAACHALTYLAVDCQYYYQLNLSHHITKESALQSLSKLSIECLFLTWPVRGGRARQEVRQLHMEEFAAYAFQFMPSLRFIALHSTYDHTTYWRRTIGADGTFLGYSQVLDEEGPDYLDYYEWRWRDQPECTAEMGEDA
ncbi:hypothetical protein BOTBODRAFT_179011 [Botryobasidium botryosum FD-172 SS1]|uniref:F-box domain-containing protein n=1 Tax=Botryobasidium botryosum (strain FD-172 SS1) TaxID=930990 RepID=A0A067M133_BOTB1|nr:hypothetical protein BOTBODRAFT_179011 [Botryobasidium botryosum FD-172 SS1]